MSEMSAFVGSVPINYDNYMGPVLFEPFAVAAATHLTTRPNMRILEVAAGTGRLTKHLLEHLPEDGRIVATDLNEDMLAIAKSKISDSRVEYQAADAQSLSFRESSFDAVMCQFGVMFFPDKLLALREAMKVLKPQRRYMYSVWAPPSRNRQAEVLQRILDEQFPDDPPTFLNVPYGFGDEKENRNLMADAGFTHIQFDTITITIDSDSAHSFAKGIVHGTPLAAGLMERGVKDLDGFAQKVGDLFVAEFGDHPMKVENTAFFVSGEKPI